MLSRLEDSFARLSRFSADLAHELRTPLNNLRGEAEVALSQARTMEEYREVLSSNLEEYDALRRIIDSLLFIARSESPEAEIRTERLEVGAELRALADFYEALASEKGVSIVLSCAENLEMCLDRTLFQRAVGNLLSNAITHTPAGGRVTLSAIADPSGVRVEVADTGQGIAREHIPHVFERFYRVDGVRTRASGGAGLGLSIVKTAVAMHGGEVNLSSDLGRGTLVTLSFPYMTKS
jgi:two-component system heavy metal sensor histidine kinase CusS